LPLVLADDILRLMKNFFAWLKTNWQTVAIIFLFFLCLKKEVVIFPFSPVKSPLLKSGRFQGKGEVLLEQEVAPTPERKERLVVKNSWLSLLVKDVRGIQEKIVKRAEEEGGYMVNSQIESPGEKERGVVTVRIPVDKAEGMLRYIRSLGIRVVSENLIGRDVTDEYTDIQSRLKALYQTKAKFEEILSQADKVADILQVQRELVNLQQQIDNLKGKEQYLQKTAATVKITVYLSTDELALPYFPAQPWRPRAIFKQAMRSLVGTFRSMGTLLIWSGVYAVIWLPLLLLYLFFRKKKS